jgi:hypothetical protein
MKVRRLYSVSRVLKISNLDTQLDTQVWNILPGCTHSLSFIDIYECNGIGYEHDNICNREAAFFGEHRKEWKIEMTARYTFIHTRVHTYIQSQGDQIRFRLMGDLFPWAVYLTISTIAQTFALLFSLVEVIH